MHVSGMFNVAGPEADLDTRLPAHVWITSNKASSLANALESRAETVVDPQKAQRAHANLNERSESPLEGISRKGVGRPSLQR